MGDSLLHYYERELTFIREMGSEFAQKYPKLAGRLLLESDKCEDPHTERLIEAFAFISGRIHKKIDDSFPEVTEALLSQLYPHYINPVPSMSVVRFDPVKKNIPPTGYKISRGIALHSRPLEGTPCEFSNSYPVNLWPVEVLSAGLADPPRLVNSAQQVIEVKLRTFNKLNISELGWESLRFFLNGPSQHIFHIYELLFNNVCHAEGEISAGGKALATQALNPREILPVGFSPEEGMLPYSKRSLPGYLLLFEYFCFPEKFLFFDLGGLKSLASAPAGDTLVVRFYLNRLVKKGLVVNASTFQLNATPVINLFKRVAEPVRVENRQHEYRVIPDGRRQRGTEVYSIDKVCAAPSAGVAKTIVYQPFYSLTHPLETDSAEKRNSFWYSQRRPSGKKGDSGTEVYLSFADLAFNAAAPGVDILSVHVTCTNRDMPARLPFGDSQGDFDLASAAPVSQVCSLIKPTPTYRPPMGGALQWRLISHLSLNYLSLVDGNGEGLKELLKLYDFENTPTTRQQINGIVAVETEYVTKRVGRSLCRGIETTLTLDEEKFVGTGLFLFASVLERFLGQYVSVNSFSQLAIKTLQRKELLKKWQPRNGNQILL